MMVEEWVGCDIQLEFQRKWVGQNRGQLEMNKQRDGKGGRNEARWTQRHTEGGGVGRGDGFRLLTTGSTRPTRGSST